MVIRRAKELSKNIESLPVKEASWDRMDQVECVTLTQIIKTFSFNFHESSIWTSGQNIIYTLWTRVKTIHMSVPDSSCPSDKWYTCQLQTQSGSGWYKSMLPLRTSQLLGHHHYTRHHRLLWPSLVVHWWRPLWTSSGSAGPSWSVASVIHC